MISSEFKFDEMNYDTSKAQEFLKEHSQFSGFNYRDSGKFVHDSVGNKICLSAICDITDYENNHNIDDIKKKLLRLSELIDKNVELFCQLEYIMRKIKPTELKAYDLKLMTQYLRYCASNKCKKNWSSKKGICMNRDSPLVILAYVAQQVLQTNQIYIVSNEETAVICWLFASLCKEAGFDNVYLRFEHVTSIPTTKLSVHDIPDFKSGCYAVVTAKSDIDSAIDVLIETPVRIQCDFLKNGHIQVAYRANDPHSKNISQFPWNLKYIYVEESIEQRFRTTLEEKVRRSRRPHADDANEEKTFIFENTRKMEPVGMNTVIVEAYRSVKELLSLLSPTPYCLSLWCDSITEGLEISSKVQSNIVWINRYGLFDGPTESSQSFFSIIDIACAEISRDLGVLDSWQEMSTSQRAGELKMFDQISETEGSFYCVRDKYICAGTREPVKVLVGSDAGNVLESSNTFKPDLLKVVVKGGRVNLLCDVTQMQEVQQLCDKLNSVGASMVSHHDNTLPDFSDIIYSWKVVWTSYGTIFSN